MVMLFVVGLLLVGCVRPNATTVEATLPLENSLPASWLPLDNVTRINLDQDPIPEYLLFFTYDGANGPVGAVIYDNRRGGTIGETDGERVDQSNRPTASLMPYPLLPSYRTYAGEGFLAEPTQKDNLSVHAIRFRADPEETESTEVLDGDALTILADTRNVTYITFVWWKPTASSPDVDGVYGIQQIYAPDHFESAPFQRFDWEAWRANPQPIEEIISVHPVHDRNLLCYRRKHVLVSPTPEQIAGSGPIGELHYQEINLGLDFCNGRPAAPFYPEGVVLAYLLGNDTLLADDLDAETAQRFATVAQPSTVVYPTNLASYKAVINLADREQTIQVCAEVLRPGREYAERLQTVSADAQGNARPLREGELTPPYTLQWLLFTLKHKPFDLGPPPLPDRLTLVDVRELPVAARHIPLDCKVQLETYSAN